MTAALMAASLSLIGAGCADEDNTGDATPPPNGMIAGQLLHAINAGPDHFVQFYDFGDGKVGVRESMPVEATALLDRVDQRLPLADVFRTIQPGAEVPKSLLAADRRMAEARLNMPTPPVGPQLPTPGETEPVSGLTSPAGAITSSGEIATVRSAAITCSGDFYNDAWGAQWFLNNYCNWGCRRECQTNWGSAHAKVEGNDRFKWKQMEGDFTNSGRISAYLTGSPYPAPHFFYDYAILPRKVEQWFFDNIGWSWQTIHALGSSPCGHLHFLKGWCD